MLDSFAHELANGVKINKWWGAYIFDERYRTSVLFLIRPRTHTIVIVFLSKCHVSTVHA